GAFSCIAPYIGHWLPHWTVISVCFIVVEELVRCKWAFVFSPFFIELLFVEVIVFYKSFNVVVLKISVILITSIACICGQSFGRQAVPFDKIIGMVDERGGLGKGVICNELIVGGCL